MVGEHEAGRVVKVRGHSSSFGREGWVVRVRVHLSSSGWERGIRVDVLGRGEGGGRGRGGGRCGLIVAAGRGVGSSTLYDRVLATIAFLHLPWREQPLYLSAKRGRVTAVKVCPEAEMALL